MFTRDGFLVQRAIPWGVEPETCRVCGMGSEVRLAGLPAGAAIEAMDSDTPGQQLQHRYKNLQIVNQS